MASTNLKILTPFLLAYTAASAFHFVHNAVFLERYPNMPDWISQFGVYSALTGIVAIGVTGYLIYVLGYQVIGLIVLGAYAAFGFDGMAHYTLAPVSQHTFTMNLTIWLEAITAAVLLAVIIVMLKKRVLGIAKPSAKN